MMEQLELLLKSIAAEDPGNMNKVWYIPPSQHALELVIFNVVFGFGMAYTIMRHTFNEPSLKKDKPNTLSTLLHIEKYDHSGFFASGIPWSSFFFL